MPATRRTGTRVRSLPDWYSEDLAGGHMVAGPVVGQVSIAGIFNNASDGSVLRVYSLTYFSNTQCELAFEVASGKPLPNYTADVSGAIDPRIGTVWGQPIAGTSAVCLGSHRGGIDVAANTPSHYTPGWCFGIVPPGYSWMIETNVANVTIEIHIFYLVTLF